MAQKKGFSLDQHNELGKELYEMTQRLTSLGFELEQAYNKKTAGLAFQAWNVLNELRSQMDEHVFKENRDLTTNENAGVYYCANRID